MFKVCCTKKSYYDENQNWVPGGTHTWEAKTKTAAKKKAKKLKKQGYIGIEIRERDVTGKVISRY